MLNRPADPAGQVQLRRYPGAGLAHLLLVRPPAFAGHHPGHPDNAAEQPGELLEYAESVGSADAAAAADHDPRRGQRHPGAAFGRLGRPHQQVGVVELGAPGVYRGGGGLGGRGGGHGIDRDGEQGRCNVEDRVLEQAARPAVPDQFERSFGVARGRDAVRHHGQAGDRAQVRHDLAAVVGAGRNHRGRGQLGGQPGQRARPRLRRVSGELDRVRVARPVLRQLRLRRGGVPEHNRGHPTSTTGHIGVCRSRAAVRECTVRRVRGRLLVHPWS